MAMRMTVHSLQKFVKEIILTIIIYFRQIFSLAFLLSCVDTCMDSRAMFLQRLSFKKTYPVI